MIRDGARQGQHVATACSDCRLNLTETLFEQSEHLTCAAIVPKYPTKPSQAKVEHNASPLKEFEVSSSETNTGDHTSGSSLNWAMVDPSVWREKVATCFHDRTIK